MTGSFKSYQDLGFKKMVPGKERTDTAQNRKLKNWHGNEYY
jgi:hypothetical protein